MKPANTSNDLWENWVGALRKELKCTRTRTYLIERELFQHYSDVVANGLGSTDPREILGESRSLAAEFNESFWAGYAARQLALIPATAVLAFFLGLTVTRCITAYSLENWFSIGNPLVLPTSLATAAINAPAETDQWALWPSPFGEKHRDDVDERLVINCRAYSGCAYGERWLFVFKRQEKYRAPDIGFQIQRSRAIVLGMDDSGRILRSEGRDWKYAENSASLVGLVLKDLFPWTAGAFALRLGILLAFEILTVAAQIMSNVMGTVKVGWSGRGT